MGVIRSLVIGALERAGAAIERWGRFPDTMTEQLKSLNAQSEQLQRNVTRLLLTPVEAQALIDISYGRFTPDISQTVMNFLARQGYTPSSADREGVCSSSPLGGGDDSALIDTDWDLSEEAVEVREHYYWPDDPGKDVDGDDDIPF